MDKVELKIKIKTAQINNALGFFILFFGIVVSVALIFPETHIQKMTNLAAGSTLIIIGGGMMWKSRRTLKSLESNK